jgi:AcrR family transcriptional regulator
VVGGGENIEKSKKTLDETVKFDDNVKSIVKEGVKTTMYADAPQASPVKRSRQQRRYGRTRGRILHAARTVFAEKGLATATVDEITARADVGRGSFYYHFESKDQLISELLKSILEALVEQMRAECDGKADLEQLLDGMITAHIGFFSKRWEDFVLYYQGRADLTLDIPYEGLETPFINYLNGIEKLVDSTSSGPIAKPRLRRLACAIAGFIAGYYSFASVATMGEDIDKEFLSLRRAFVSSLARFAREALPDSVVR